ncbi:MAG: ATP-binding protein [Gammaproteobacteria bacterium]|nr:ATP-binding protein [Gammaproteobacteria bacterium]
MAENRSFRMHENLLYSVIKNQAGTVEKAIQEAIQNSIDAQATKVIITLDGNHFLIEDDGRGFQSRKEIEDHFEQFGTPHEAGDARYGRFRMGRGQLFAFGVNTWISQQFLMKVDIKNKGLDYILDDGQTPFPGCQVRADLYEPLTLSQQLNLLHNLKRLCAYSEIPVIVNGETISQDPKVLKGFEDLGDAYYKPASQGPLQVYNMGMYVASYDKSRYGVSGIVVSKQALEVNFARNDILTQQCAVWKNLSKTLKARGDQAIIKSRRTVLSDEERRFVIQGLLSGGPITDEVQSLPIIAMANGKYLSLKTWGMRYRTPYTVTPDGQERVAGRLAHDGHKVVATETPEEWGTTPKKLDEVLRRYTGYSGLCTDYVPFAVLARGYSADHHEIDEKKLTANEKEILRLLRAKNRHIRDASLFRGAPRWENGFYNNPENAGRVRTIKVGESQTAEAWTDGVATITINREILKEATKKPEAIFKLVGLVLHEYLHTGGSAGKHEHPHEFYESFHDAILDDEINKIALRMAGLFFARYLPKQNKAVVGREMNLVVDGLGATPGATAPEGQSPWDRAPDDLGEDEEQETGPR